MPVRDDREDLEPAQTAKWRFVRRRAFAVLQGHGFREVRPSPVEPLGQAARIGASPALQLGEGELRSDLQGSLARMFHLSGCTAPFTRWMAVGPVFAARPSPPLDRQVFEAVSALSFGVVGPVAEVELIGATLQLAGDLSLDRPELVVGSIGDEESLRSYAAATAQLRRFACAGCQAAPDPLRFLTCQEGEECLALSENAPPIREHLSPAARRHHDQVLTLASSSGFVVTDDPRLGFGAGRYDRTVFELRARSESDPQGRPRVVARGGRRDRLVERLGGRSTPAVGLTVSVDRAATCVPGDPLGFQVGCEIYIAADPGGRAWALRTAAAQRGRGFRVDVDLQEEDLPAQLHRAEEQRARVIVLARQGPGGAVTIEVIEPGRGPGRKVPEAALSTELKRLLR